jgi:hypothetical protein
VFRLIEVFGIRIAKDLTGTHFSSFPCALLKWEEEKKRVMKVLRQILFTIVIAVGLAVTASAQNSNQQPPKPPPKEGTPPKIKVPDDKKPPPREEKPKKPGMAFLGVKRYSDDTI